MDSLSPEKRSANMARIRARDTKPEWTVRRLLHSLGYRYRLHRRDLPGHPDIVFSSRRKIIFVHGCFWHQHDPKICRAGRLPKSNLGYWEAKLLRNVERDDRNLALLNSQGWDVKTVWECETKDIELLRKSLVDFIEGLAQS
ncbi:DNA mismatch endonuclease Vsr [Ensifer sp. PDNC004]|nr:DNA mismatch endonuclease Vsr [Ensifer sp. PDNC004]